MPAPRDAASDALGDTLRAAAGPPAAAPAGARDAVLVAGGGGALGAELVEQLLGSARFGAVVVLAKQPLRATVARLRALRPDDPVPAARVGIVVFDRERHANRRDEAFARPDPAGLPALAARWHAAGVANLLVVMPHDAAGLPAALKAGLASLPEQAVAALGFERFAILRSAAAPGALTSRGLQRLADWLLAQLRVMAPENLQPVRARTVARVAAAVAAALPSAPPGTRVLPPERVWQAARLADPAPFVDAWLAGRELPEMTVRVPRM